MTAIIDYDAGNIRSVEKALLFLGEETVVTRDPAALLAADRVILPGVGAFGDAMKRLREFGLVEVIREIAERGTPLLGICLGLQILFESSEESPGEEGLGLLKGRILRIPERLDECGQPIKIPHIGWNSLALFPEEGLRNNRLFWGLPKAPYVYFVHSYYLKAREEQIVKASVEYGTHIHASVEKDNIFACQFHPEKSGDIGLKILQNFAGR